MKKVVVDIDGTLVDVDFIPTAMYTKIDWDSLNEERESAPVFQWCVEIVNAMYLQGFEIVFVTGRSSTERILASTNKKLKSIFPEMRYTMYMRNAYEDEPPCLDVKKNIFSSYLPVDEVLFVLEDMKHIQDWLSENGYTCLLFKNRKNP